MQIQKGYLILLSGDFWGLGNDSNMHASMREGVSAILVITDKGQELLKNSKEEMILEKREAIEAVNGNSQLKHPSVRHKKQEFFKKKYLENGFEVACKKSLRKENIKAKIKLKLKSIYKMLKRG